jgi:hypothetical protein
MVESIYIQLLKDQLIKNKEIIKNIENKLKKMIKNIKLNIKY